MIDEIGVADLDTPRQAHNVESSWTAQNRPIPAESAAAAERIERGLESHRPRPVVDHGNTFPTGQTNRFPCKLAFVIYDHMIGARILRDSNLVFVGHATNYPATSQLDDLGQKNPKATCRSVHKSHA